MVFACGVRWKTSSRFVSIRAAAVSSLRILQFAFPFLSRAQRNLVSFFFFQTISIPRWNFKRVSKAYSNRVLPPPFFSSSSLI